MKRGRITVVDLEDQKKVFNKYQEYFQPRNNLPSCNDTIFTEIRNELDQKISVKGLYLSVKRNYDYFFPTNNKEESKQTYIDSKCENEESSDESDAFDEIETLELTNVNTLQVSVSFSLDIYQWHKIQPISKCTVRRKHDSGGNVKQHKYVLPKYEWADLLREEIWTSSKLPCSWSFKSHFIKFGERVTCLGECTQCHAKIQVIIKWPSNNIASCSGIVTNFDKDFRHNTQKKIKMSPSTRKNLLEELKNEAPIVVHKRLFDAALQVGDNEPSHLSTHGCLRQIKHEYNVSQHYHSDPILALLIMAKNVKPYDNFIKQITIHPHFYVYYWSLAQETLYVTYSDSNRVIMSVDATGSIIKESDIIEKKHIFLYEALIYCDQNGRSVPTTQMLSSSHTLDAIYLWLKSWLGNKPVPNEVVLDDSSALIGATVKAFTDCKSTNEYLKESFTKLESAKRTPQECYVRLDTSHFVKIIFNLSCFKNVDTRTKNFYCKCIQYVKDLDDYEEIKRVISDIITVCINKHDNAGSHVQEAKLRLKQLGKSITIREYDENDVPEDKSKIDSEITYSKDDDTTLPQWFSDKLDYERLVMTLTQDDDDISAHENLFYMPSLIPTLTRLVRQLPLWTNVMMRIYQSTNIIPSSSNVESYFKTLKRYLCHIAIKSNRLRLDDFIVKHINFIEGEIKEAISNVTNVITTCKTKSKAKREQKMTSTEKGTEIIFPNESIFSETPSFVENWKGKGKSNKKDTKMGRMHKKVLLLLNGTRTLLGKDIVVSNTCAFDTVSQIIAAACVEGFDVRNKVFCSDNKFCKFVKAMIDDKTIRSDLYKSRADILLQHFTKQCVGDKTYVSCECNVSFIFDNILIDELFSASLRESCTNTACTINNVQRNISFLPLNYNMPISALNQSAESMLCEDNNIAQCRHNQCIGVRTYTFQLSNTIAFELNQKDVISLDDVPIEINLNNIKYDVIGVIEFLSSYGEATNIKAIGHYRAHCRQNMTWKCYDDLKCNVTKSPKRMIANCIIYGRKTV